MIDASALIETGVKLGLNVDVWRNTHVRSGAVIGSNVKIGENVYIGSNLKIGDNTKIQNGALIYEASMIEDQVFIGPAVCFTNDKNPRSTNSQGQLKANIDWTLAGVKVRTGASIGAGVICIAPLEIGRWSMIGSGSVVTQDVCAYGLYVGNPAKKIGWVNREGYRLTDLGGSLYCDETNQSYSLQHGELIALVE